MKICTKEEKKVCSQVFRTPSRMSNAFSSYCPLCNSRTDFFFRKSSVYNKHLNTNDESSTRQILDDNTFSYCNKNVSNKDV